MQTRSKSALKSVSLQQEGACSIGNIPRCTVRINGTALADQLAVAAAKQSPACTTSSDAALAGTIPVEQHAQQPLELLAGIVEAYVSALDDAEAVEAAQAVAGIWHAHDTDTRARLSAVLGPLLERESQLQQRATAIAAKREARRAKVSEQGPRRSVRKRAGASSDDIATGAHDPSVGSNNNSNNKRHCSSTEADPQTSPCTPSTPPESLSLPDPSAPPSPLLNNQQLEASATPPPADLNAGSSSGGSSGSSRQVGGSNSPSSSPEPEAQSIPGEACEMLQQQQQQQVASAEDVCEQQSQLLQPFMSGSRLPDQQQQQLELSEVTVCGCAGLRSRRKQLLKPHAAALQ